MSRSASIDALFPSVCDVAALSQRPHTLSNARWRPGLAAEISASCHNEVFASGDEASGAAAAVALALDDWRNTPREEGVEVEDMRSILWVQTCDAVRLNGRPYRAGLPQDVQKRLIHVCADSCADALFALEEGVRCRDIAFVIGELAGNAKALDFTASRRLTLAAERHGVPLYLVRLNARRDLSSARMRWDVTSAASQPPKWNAQAPGESAWRAELFRARSHPPGRWVLSDNGKKLKARKAMTADNDTLLHSVGSHSWAAGLRQVGLRQRRVDHALAW